MNTVLLIILLNGVLNTVLLISTISILKSGITITLETNGCNCDTKTHTKEDI